jgi:hypothetical protein
MTIRFALFYNVNLLYAYNFKHIVQNTLNCYDICVDSPNKAKTSTRATCIKSTLETTSP